ncbi:MAG: S9 family peptidase [Aeromonas sp.]
MPSTSALLPPVARRQRHTFTLHGDSRHDNYHWLRDDTRQDKAVLAHLAAENAYTEQMLAPHAALRERLYQEMVARIPGQDESVPYVKNGYRYQTRYAPGEEYPSYWRQATSAAAAPELLLDSNARASQHDFYELGALVVSPDNQWLAVAEDMVARRQYQVQLKNLVSGQWLPTLLDNTSGDVAWAQDSQTLFYVRKHPQTLLPYQVYRHQLGSDPASDVLVYEEHDDAFYLSLDTSTSRDFIVLTLSATTTSEAWLIDAKAPTEAPRCFLPRQTGHEYELDHYREQFYLRSNREGKNFALYVTPGASAPWQTLLAPRAEVLLENLALFAEFYAVQERAGGLTRLRFIHWQSGVAQTISFDDPAYVTWLGYHPEPDTTRLRYGYTSLTTPVATFELDMHSGERQLLKQQHVAGFERSHYRSERLLIAARDGTNVPVSLVYRTDKVRPGQNAAPLLIYGYGAYGASLDPEFSSARLSLLDRGFVYAIAHIRGGEELGRDWYDAGRLAYKQNSFNDFIDVTRSLVAQGYGAADQVFAMGGSAGGLLMGALANQAPELYCAMVAQVPFVDVLTTMLDASIPLTTGEYEEWGNPHQAVDYACIKAYSPYDNVTSQAYPHLLITTGLHDSQVQYWEPAKWVAKLRELKTDDHTLLLLTDMDAGHGGKSGRLKAYADSALEWAFLLSHCRQTVLI